MNVRAGSGWQTVLADLSLILFMVMAAAVGDARSANGALVQGDPVAQWRAGADTPALRDWLDQQPPDPRQQLTIVAHPDAVGPALSLARSSGRAFRLILDPRAETAPVAILAYDIPVEKEL